MQAQKGFTLIELISVIVILGILAAVALPKFVNLSSEARIAKMQGAVGSVQSAAALVHAKWLAQGSKGDVVYEGGTIAEAQMINGYPSAEAIAAVAGIVDGQGFEIEATSGTVVTIVEQGKDTCEFTYTEAAANNAPAVNSASLTATNC